MSSGVAGCDPPIVCAKLVPAPGGCLTAAADGFEPFAGAPKPQLLPVTSSQGRPPSFARTAPQKAPFNVPILETFCNLDDVADAGVRFGGAPCP